MKIGDIILVPFPFSELSNIKVRPAVIITETMDKYNDLVVSAISSVIPEFLSSREIMLFSTSLNHLKVDSVIKADRIVTIKRQHVITCLGELSEKELTEFKAVLTSMIT